MREDKKGHASEKLNIIAGLLNHKLIAPLTYRYSTDTSLFNTWLENCLIPVLPEKSVIIMDNARFHKSDKTRSLIEQHGHTLLFLPAYSPDLNPIEQYWAIIKSKIKKSRLYIDSKVLPSSVSKRADNKRLPRFLAL